MARSPDDSYTRVLRARAYLGLKKPDDAMKDLDYVLNAKPNFLAALALRGITWSALRDYGKAVDDLDRAIAQKETVESLFARARAHEALGHPGKATDDFRRATQLPPTSSIKVPITEVMARLRQSGATRDRSEIPAATIQPVSDECANPDISCTPSSETVGRMASGRRSVASRIDGGARLPKVSCAFGTRANTTPLPSTSDSVQSSLGRCFSRMLWNIATGGLKEMS